MRVKCTQNIYLMSWNYLEAQTRRNSASRQTVAGQVDKNRLKVNVTLSHRAVFSEASLTHCTQRRDYFKKKKIFFF